MRRQHLSRLVPSVVALSLMIGCGGTEQNEQATAPTTTPQETASAEPEATNISNVKYAIIETNMGTIKLELFPDKAPKTVENFVGLAEGTKMWIHPMTGRKQRTHFYDGLLFHRVIPGFMIQGGDPVGTGNGDPGYRFEDEIVPDLKFDKPGLLAMANAGSNTNGSQFFITVAPTEHLNGKHTIFGHVVEGMDVVNKIANTSRDSNDRPINPVVMQKVTIERESANDSDQPTEGGKSS